MPRRSCRLHRASATCLPLPGGHSACLTRSSTVWPCPTTAPSARITASVMRFLHLAFGCCLRSESQAYSLNNIASRNSADCRNCRRVLVLSASLIYPASRLAWPAVSVIRLHRRQPSGCATIDARPYARSGMSSLVVRREQVVAEVAAGAPQHGVRMIAVVGGVVLDEQVIALHPVVVPCPWGQRPLPGEMQLRAAAGRLPSRELGGQPVEIQGDQLGQQGPRGQAE